MHKMGNLVLNETIKTLRKISTLVLLISIILLAIGFNSILWIASRQTQPWDEKEWQIENYTRQIEEAQSQRYPGWEEQAERLTALRDNFTYISWKNEALSNIFTAKDALEETTVPAEKANLQAQIERLQRALDQDNWRDYIKLVYIEPVESNDALTQEEKESALWMWRFCLDNNLEPTYLDEEGRTLWKYSYLYSVQSAKTAYEEQLALPEAERDKMILEQSREQYLIGEYRLENDIEVSTQKTDDTSTLTGTPNFWSVFSYSSVLLSIIGVLIIIVAGGMISSEFSGGTIKFLLINPVKRWKIFASKYITVIAAAFAMLLLFYIFNALLAMLFFGASDIGAPYLYLSGDTVKRGSSFLFVAGKYLLGSIGTVVMATFAFALSSLVRSSALSIGLGIFLMLAGSGAVSILWEVFRFDWARYIVFANVELNSIAMGYSSFADHTLTFAVINLCVYMVVFLLTAWDGFMRRDIR